MGFLRNMTLQKRTGLLVSLSSVLGLALFSWLGIQSLNESTQRIMDERLTISRIVASHLDETLHNTMVQLKYAVNFQGKLPDETYTREKARALAAILAEQYIIVRGVFLIDNQGMILLSEPDTIGGEGSLLFEKSDLESITAGGNIGISSLVNTSLIETPVVFAIYPIQDSGGRSIGALSVAIDVQESSISGFIQPITLGNTGYVEIVDKNGLVMARTMPGIPPKAYERSDHPGRFAQLMVEGKAVVRTCHRCHGPESQPVRARDVLAFAPLSIAPWGVAIRQSEEEAFAIAETLKKRLLINGGIVVVGMFLVVWIVIQGVVRPVKMLTAAAEKVAKGDFKAIVPIERRDEIGRLGSAFSVMTRQLNKVHSELVSRNRDLLALNSIAVTVSLSLELEEILAKSTQKVLTISESEAGCVFLVDARNKGLKLVSYVGSRRLFQCSYLDSPGANCACYQVLRYKQTLLVKDVSQCPALGEEVMRRKGTNCFVSVPLISKDKVLGVMNVVYSEERGFTEDDLRLMQSVGYHIGMAVENSMLYKETRHKEELRGQLLSTIINAQEEERKRISRDLHDGCAQNLTGLIMSIESAETIAPPQDSVLAQKLTGARLIAVHALEDMRKIMRGLRSTDLDELGLVAAIRANAQSHLESADIRLDFEAQGFIHPLPPPIETALFRIVQEAVNNIIKHSGAQTVTVRMRMEVGKIIASVSDDGHGFDTAAFFDLDGRKQSLGLLGMLERANLLGGVFSINSTPGKGTLLIVEIPVDSTSDGKEKSDG